MGGNLDIILWGGGGGEGGREANNIADGEVTRGDSSGGGHYASGIHIVRTKKFFPTLLYESFFLNLLAQKQAFFV